MFTENANRIFNEAIEEYHRWDDVDHPISNPYAAGTIDHLLYEKNWIDTVQWHLEDIIRDPQIDPVEALKIKRRIDRSNQERTDMVEYIDSYLLDIVFLAAPLYGGIFILACIGTAFILYGIFRIVLAFVWRRINRELSRSGGDGFVDAEGVE